jgi:hypothetical protein
MKNSICTKLLFSITILSSGIFAVHLHAQHLEEENAHVPDRMAILGPEDQLTFKKSVSTEKPAGENHKAAEGRQNDALVLAAARQEVVFGDEVRCHAELPEAAPVINNNRQAPDMSYLPTDTLKPKRISARELRQLPFRTMSDSALRINYVIARDKGTERLVIGGIVVGIALVGIASGVRNIDVLTGDGIGLILGSFWIGGALSTIPFISAGRNIRKAKRIRNEWIRRGNILPVSP